MIELSTAEQTGDFHVQPRATTGSHSNRATFRGAKAAIKGSSIEDYVEKIKDPDNKTAVYVAVTKMIAAVRQQHDPKNMPFDKNAIHGFFVSQGSDLRFYLAGGPAKERRVLSK